MPPVQASKAGGYRRHRDRSVPLGHPPAPRLLRPYILYYGAGTSLRTRRRTRRCSGIARTGFDRREATTWLRLRSVTLAVRGALRCGRNFRYLQKGDAPGRRTEEYKGSVRAPGNADAVTTVAVNPKSRPTASERGDHLPGRPPAPRSSELRQRALDPTVGPRTCSPIPQPRCHPLAPHHHPPHQPHKLAEHAHWELLRFVGVPLRPVPGEHRGSCQKRAK